jgi:energy-coupling factor transporter transmembrane protein EcfT
VSRFFSPVYDGRPSWRSRQAVAAATFAIPLLFSPVVLLLLVVVLVLLLVVPQVLPVVFVVLVEFVLLLIVVAALLVVLLLVMVVGEEKLAAGFVLLPPHPAEDRQSPIIIQEKIYFMIDRFSLDFVDRRRIVCLHLNKWREVVQRACHYQLDLRTAHALNTALGA